MAYPIIGLVGPSGSGKTTLILRAIGAMPERIAIVRSITTRPRRDEMDALFYEFVTPGEVLRRRAAGRLIQTVEYAGAIYGNDRAEFDRVLGTHVGIAALVEDGIENIRQAGYRVVVVRVMPEGHTPRADARRLEDDARRAAHGLPADLEITNSFAPGGLDRAVETLTRFIASLP